MPKAPESNVSISSKRTSSKPATRATPSPTRWTMPRGLNRSAKDTRFAAAVSAASSHGTLLAIGHSL